MLKEIFRSTIAAPVQRCTIAAVGALLCVAMLPTPGVAQDWDDPIETDRGQYDRRYDAPPPQPVRYDDPTRVEYADHVGWGARLGLGFVADPSSFLVDIAVPYNTGSGVNIGPRIQLGLAEDRTFVAPTISIEYSHDLRSVIAGPFGYLRPLIQAGVGLSILEKDKRRGQNSDVDFLFDIGAGFEYPLTDGFAVASVIDFNVIPRESLDETLIFTWQVLQFRVQF